MKEQNQTNSGNIKWHNLTIDRDKLEKMRGHKGMVCQLMFWMEIILGMVYAKILVFRMKIERKI